MRNSLLRWVLLFFAESLASRIEPSTTVLHICTTGSRRLKMTAAWYWSLQHRHKKPSIAFWQVASPMRKRTLQSQITAGLQNARVEHANPDAASTFAASGFDNPCRFPLFYRRSFHAVLMEKKLFYEDCVCIRSSALNLYDDARHVLLQSLTGNPRISS